MRLAIVAVGRLRPSPERTLFEHYAGRIRWPLAVHEVEERRPLPIERLIAREGELLRAACPKGAKIIRAARAFDALLRPDGGGSKRSPSDVVQELRKDASGGYDPDVLDAIERIAPQTKRSETLQPASS